ncbi:lantibiotic dehydratase [Streptomyces sp. NPDC051776]|uniref:lantibiotic dehydratase n=1 Tax=Streptomyces sp. NPDC051776 TaxID=3155414 RepID=UPI00342204BB
MLSRRFMLRVAGLPVESVHGLRCPESRRWADDVLTEEDRLRAAGESIGDRLHALVGGCTDESRRRTLLALRREVFNNRLPRDPGAAVDLVAALDASTAEVLAAWLEERREWKARRAQGAGLVAADLGRSREELRRLAGEERLRRGLLLASPSLDAQIDDFVATAGPRPDKRQRKIERSVVAYLYRTACKTSPFSTFTGVALGAFERAEGRAAGDRTVRIDTDWTSHPQLNVVALGRLAEAVTDHRERRADLPVSLASGWGRDDDRVRYVRRLVTAGDDDTAVTFDSVKDRLFFLRRSGTLERMISLFEQQPVLRYGELVHWLAAEQEAPEEECERYLEALLGLGMIEVPGLRTGVHDIDPLRAFQDSLRDLDRPWAEELAQALEGPASYVERFAHASPAERRGLLQELRGGLRRIQVDLGAERAKVPQTVLYEDAVAGRDVACDPAAWTELAEGPLRAVERVLPAFDLTLPQRITLKGFFLARYGQGGRCDDLLKLVHDFHEDFFDQYLSFTAGRKAYDAEGRYVPEENWLGLPQIKALDTARQAFSGRMRSLWDAWSEAAAGGEESGELCLDGAFLEEVAGELTTVTPDFATLSHHFQLSDGADGPLFVLNRSFGGLSFPFSRFTHCFDGLDEELRAHAGTIEPDGVVFAEVTGGSVTSNLNLHGRLTDHEIICPGETGTLPAECQLRLDDLYIEHDEAGDRLVLRSARLGREVVPVYLGYLVPLALPEIPRTLLLLSPTSIAPLDVWGGIPESESENGVTRRPRVRHGNVVLSRRRWSAPASVLPLRAPGVSDEDWFLEWHRWRRAHGLPDRVFATVSDGGGRGATGSKPSCVDFDSFLSLTAFEALLKNSGARVAFREMLPEEDGLHAVSDRGRHVAELAVETVFSTRGSDET